MLIDVHTHCHQPQHRGADWLETSKRAYGDRDWSFSPADYSRVMNEAGVSTAVIFGVTANAIDLKTPNDFVADFCSQVDLDTIPFMALDPTAPEFWDDFEDGCRRGFKGVKLYPVSALFDPTDTAYDRFYSRCSELGLVILWHMGATPNPNGSLVYSNPLVIDEVARRHPTLTQVIAHMGHPWQREAVIVIRKNVRVFADVSASWARPQDGFQALVRAQEWGVVDKLIFGSDFPHWTPAEAIEGLRSLAARRPHDMPHIEANTIEHLIDSDHLATLGLRAS